MLCVLHMIICYHLCCVFCVCVSFSWAKWCNSLWILTATWKICFIQIPTVPSVLRLFPLVNSERFHISDSRLLGVQLNECVCKNWHREMNLFNTNSTHMYTFYIENINVNWSIAKSILYPYTRQHWLHNSEHNRYELNREKKKDWFSVLEFG